MNEKVKNLLICKYENCNKYFKDPVMLSCGKSVCKIHIEDLLRNDNIEKKTFKCKMCKGQHLVEEEAFILNNDLKDFLEEGDHLPEKQKNIKELYDEFEETLNKLQKILKDPANYLHEYISDIKREVDLQREVLKSKIDEIALDIISKIDELNEESKVDIKEIENIDLSKFNTGLVEFKDYSRMLYIEENRLEKNCKELSDLSKESKKILDDLEKKLLKGKTCKFERNGKKIFNSDFGTFTYEEEIKLEALMTLKGHDESVAYIEYLDNNELASCSNDKTVKIWDLESGECLSTLEGHSLEVNILCVLSDNRLASGSDDKTVKIWDLETYECLETMEVNSPIYSLIELTDFLIGGLLNGSIIVWDVEQYDYIKKIKEHSDCVRSLLKLSDEYFASASYDHSIKIWESPDFNELSVIYVLSEHLGPVNDLKLMKNGNFVSVSDDNCIKIWDKINFDCIFSYKNDDSIFNLEISNESDCLIFGDALNNLKFLNIAHPNQCSKTFLLNEYYCFVQIPNGNWVISSNEDIIIYKNEFDIYN
jgi:WD40 repeat protein